MTGRTPGKPPKSREDRLKAALKANMARRKTQARERDMAAARVQGTDRRADDEAGEDERDG